MKFLDSAGLKVVLTKIKDMFYTKTEVDEKLKSVSGGGTKVEEFILKCKSLNGYEIPFLRLKIIKTESITHFFIKAEKAKYSNSHKEQDFITCDNKYEFRTMYFNSGGTNYMFNGEIGINGLIIRFGSFQNPKEYIFSENSWIYLGGVPTSEIHKK